MKAASVQEIQKELTTLNPTELKSIILRLAKYKNENKELISFMLYHSHAESDYVALIKSETEMAFEEMNKSNLYLFKKSLRKILRSINKYIRFSGNKISEIELRIHFLKQIKLSMINYEESTVLVNLYQSQLNKIDKILNSLHEDVKFDYKKEYEELF